MAALSTLSYFTCIVKPPITTAPLIELGPDYQIRAILRRPGRAYKSIIGGIDVISYLPL